MVDVQAEMKYALFEILKPSLIAIPGEHQLLHQCTNPHVLRNTNMKILDNKLRKHSIGQVLRN